VITEEPEFTETIENVTVPAGKLMLLLLLSCFDYIQFHSPFFSIEPDCCRLLAAGHSGRNVKLACSVKNLGSYKVRYQSTTNEI